MRLEKDIVANGELTMDIEKTGHNIKVLLIKDNSIDQILTNNHKRVATWKYDYIL